MALSSEDMAVTVEAIRPDVIVGDRIQLEKWGLAVGEEIGEGLAGWTVLVAAGIAAENRWGDGVVIGMTSGSTGRSKGVVHSEASMRYAVANEIAAAGLVAGDAVGVIVPLSAAPAFALRLALGEMADALLLSSQRVAPQALEKLGYSFLHSDLSATLKSLV